MKIVKRKIKELKPANYNPRQMTKDEVHQLKTSLEKFGMVDPIIVNMRAERKNTVVGGHMRMNVWSGMGNKEIDTVEVNLSEAQEKELNIRLNLNNGHFDYDKLANEFDTEKLLEFGFKEKELQIDDPGDDAKLPRYEDQVEFKVKLSKEQRDMINKTLGNLRRTKKFREAEFKNADKKGNALFFLVEEWLDPDVEESE